MNLKNYRRIFEFFLENPVLTFKTRRIDMIPLYRRVLLLTRRFISGAPDNRPIHS